MTAHNPAHRFIWPLLTHHLTGICTLTRNFYVVKPWLVAQVCLYPLLHFRMGRLYYSRVRSYQLINLVIKIANIATIGNQTKKKVARGISVTLYYRSKFILEKMPHIW